MAYFDYAAIAPQCAVAVAEGKLLEGSSIVVALAALAFMNDRDNWLEMSDSQWDEVAEWIDQASYDIMRIVDTVTIGAIVAFPGAVPENWLLCNGDTYVIGDYLELFAYLGESYRVSEYYFRVPDLVGKVVRGTSGGLGSEGGEDRVTLGVSDMPSHKHTHNSHTHSIPVAVGVVTAGAGAPIPVCIPGVGVTGSTLTNENDKGGDGSHENWPPFIRFRYCIKAR